MTSTKNIFDTAEEAVEEAKKQAEAANVSPTSVMISFAGGYATGDGNVHSANGVVSKPAVATEPAVEEAVEAVEPVAEEAPVAAKKTARKTVSDEVNYDQTEAAKIEDELLA